MYTMISAVPPGGNRQNVRQHDKFFIFAHMHLSSFGIAFVHTVFSVISYLMCVLHNYVCV